MKRRILLVLAAGLLVGADSRKEDAVKKERDRLQGYWDVVAVERNGAKVPAKDIKRVQFIFTDKKMTLSRANKQSFDATYKLDAAPSPKTLDITFLMGPDEGKTFRAVYTLEGKTLKICWSESGQKRPTGFTTQPKSARTLFVLKRGKP